MNAFVDLIRERGGDRYDFSLRETQTYEIIEDVAQRKSEIGLLYLNDFNRTALQKLLRGPIWILRPCLPPTPMCFSAAITRSPVLGQCLLTIWRRILICPLSRGSQFLLFFGRDLQPGSAQQNIRVRDRATLFNLLIGLQGYTVCSGVIDSKLNGENIVAVPLTGVAPMEIGYILPAGVQPGSLCRAYIENLKQYVPID